MAKTKAHGSSSGPKSSPASVLVSGTGVDPVLASLFAASSGPVKVPEKTSFYSPKSLSNERPTTRDYSNGSDHPNARTSRSRASADSDAHSSASETAAAADESTDRPRKRRRIGHDEDLEATYLNRLAREEDKEAAEKEKIRHSRVSLQDEPEEQPSTESDEQEDVVHSDDQQEIAPVHESLAKSMANDVEDKSKRTVFLSNVSTDAIKSKSAKKALIAHLKSALDVDSDKSKGDRFESLRFRSTAFVSDAGPKKAAFAKKELMDQTMKSTNAYAVFSTEAAAKQVAARLNGSMVLERHLRVDNLAHPAEIDHRRCIFVGNLSFVDQETGEGAAGEEGSQRRPKAKVPADAEEGLWRTFNKVGSVESVRVVRDKETRISKGFAYVQFADENGVEAALLMNDKKFPPMLPRKLRVMRAKRVKQRSAVDGRQSGRREDPKRRNRSDRPSLASRTNGGPRQSSRPSSFVFEGHRASKSAQNTARKPKGKRAAKPNTRSSRRGAVFKATGGKRKQEGQQ